MSGAGAAGLSLPEAVCEVITKRGWGGVHGAEALSGGINSQALRIYTASGPSVVLKRHIKPTPPDGIYYHEAEGLRALAMPPGAPRVPVVYAVGDDYLLIEDLGAPLTEPTDQDWARFGRAVAALHRRTNCRFGYDFGPHLGVSRQRFIPMDDGPEHWLVTRLLHFLAWPFVQEALTSRDLDDLQRFADVFRRIVPRERPALIHGDLWRANAFFTRSGEPVLIDPDADFGLREHDVALARQGGGIPEAFFDAYDAAFPLAPGWRERLEIYYPCIPLGMIAYFGNQDGHLEQLRGYIRRFL